MMFRLVEFFSRLYAAFFYSAGRHTFISRLAEIVGKNSITFGDSVRILKFAKLDTSTNPSAPDYRKNTRNGRIVVGNNTKIKEFAFLISYDGFIEVGDNCTINPFTIIYGQGGVKIGNNVMIAAQSLIVSANHGFDDTMVPMKSQSIRAEGIQIHDDVWIGAAVKILDGVVIGEGSIVAAGSVVTTSLEPFGIYAGTPAKLIRKRT